MTGNGRRPPYSAEAEISVLGGCLVDPEAVVEVRPRLAVEDFYREAHRRIYRAMCDLSDAGTTVDVIVLADRLKDQGEIEAVGGHSYLAELIDAVPTAANIEHHAAVVRDKARLRRLIDACEASIRDAYEVNGGRSDQIIEQAERRIYAAVEERGVGEGFRSPKAAIWGAMELIEEEAKREGGVTGLPTGFPTWDQMTTGLHKGGVTVLAARPSMGKSSLAWRICAHVADHLARGGGVVAISSLEMSEAELVKRGLAQRARIDLMKIRAGALDKPAYKRLAAAAGWLNNLPLRIDDRPSATLHDVRAKLRRLSSHSDPRLLMIDYLQLMDGEGRNRVQQIGSLTRGLKRVAREFSLHVILLSQLSRAVEARKPPRPVLSDLRESGDIEQDADNVVLLWRPEYYWDAEQVKEKKPQQYAKWHGKAEIIVAKQRNGPTGDFLLNWDAGSTTFTEAARRHEEERASAAEEAPPWAL